MIIEKNLKISQVIVNERNIEDLIAKISEEYRSDTQIIENKYELVNIKIRFLFITDDDIRYDSDNQQDFFLNGRYLLNKRVKDITINYTNYKIDKRININISNLSPYSGNTILISGKDELWVNGIYKYFEDYISTWEKQENWFKRFNILLSVISTLIFGISYFFILRFLGILIFLGEAHNLYESWFNLAPASKYYVLVLVCLLSLMFGLITRYFTLNKINALYPNIEFKLGPEYKQKEKLKRNLVSKIITIIIIPVIISIIAIIVGVFLK